MTDTRRCNCMVTQTCGWPPGPPIVEPCAACLLASKLIPYEDEAARVNASREFIEFVEFVTLPGGLVVRPHRIRRVAVEDSPTDGIIVRVTFRDGDNDTVRVARVAGMSVAEQMAAIDEEIGRTLNAVPGKRFRRPTSDEEAAG